ncbi:unnamed protein product [Timema podura]|uniref:Uncharacterized protein n=1 Tax=Timema podura TaxID=61482 RepID=A0ABN7PIT5_TIMPD|nr:unnamed protein product [Timema podura]
MTNSVVKSRTLPQCYSQTNISRVLSNVCRVSSDVKLVWDTSPRTWTIPVHQDAKFSGLDVKVLGYKSRSPGFDTRFFHNLSVDHWVWNEVNSTLYQHQYENCTYICKTCHTNGQEVIVIPKLTSSSDTSWFGLAKFAWSG